MAGQSRSWPSEDQVHEGSLIVSDEMEQFSPYAVGIPAKAHTFADPEKRIAASDRSAEVRRARLAETQRQNKVRARAAAETELGDAVGVANEAANSQALNHLTLEEMADKGTRMYLRILLTSGETFMPSSPRECMELASACSQIAYRQVQRTRALARPEEEDDVRQAAGEAMRLLNRKAKAIQRGA
jgi:hypothetical protein